MYKPTYYYIVHKFWINIRYTFLWLLVLYTAPMCLAQYDRIEAKDINVQIAETRSKLANAESVPEKIRAQRNLINLLYFNGDVVQAASSAKELQLLLDHCNYESGLARLQCALVLKTPNLLEMPSDCDLSLSEASVHWVNGAISSLNDDYFGSLEAYYAGLLSGESDSNVYLANRLFIDIASDLVKTANYSQAIQVLNYCDQDELMQYTDLAMFKDQLTAIAALSLHKLDRAEAPIRSLQGMAGILNSPYWSGMANMLDLWFEALSENYMDLYVFHALELQLGSLENVDLLHQVMILKAKLMWEINAHPNTAEVLTAILNEDLKYWQRAEALQLKVEIEQSLGLFQQALITQSSLNDVLAIVLPKAVSKSYESLNSGYQQQLQNDHLLDRDVENEINYKEQQLQQILVYVGLVVLLILSVLSILLYRQTRIKEAANLQLEERTLLINKQNQELREVNTVLDEARKQAEAGSVAKSNFLAMTSHEIRTPMNGIMGMASLLLESELSEEQKKYVETISTSSENLLTILNDILDFSKIEAGKLHIEHSLIDLEQLLDEIMIMFAKQAKDKNIELSKFIGNAIINQFKGDTLRIRQVLINLVSNAVKFTEDGKVKVMVELDELMRAQTEDSRIAKLKFSVIDDGIGIAPDKLATIFDSFEQEDNSTSRKYGGIGLGLSISKKLVELMGGEIGVVSDKGRGTTFFFTLTVEIPHSARKQDSIKPEVATDKKSEVKSDVIANEHPLNILLAEDNPFNKLLVDKLLEKFGYEHYLHAENGMEVLSLLKKNDVDLILMDIQMPEMDGMEATKRIIESYGNKRPVIIALTADANEGSKNEYLSAGMDGFLSKPFKAEELRNILVEQSLAIKEQKALLNQ